MEDRSPMRLAGIASVAFGYGKVMRRAAIFALLTSLSFCYTFIVFDTLSWVMHLLVAVACGRHGSMNPTFRFHAQPQMSADVAAHERSTTTSHRTNTRISSVFICD